MTWSNASVKTTNLNPHRTLNTVDPIRLEIMDVSLEAELSTQRSLNRKTKIKSGCTN